jgi:hypothetical protein
MRLRIRNFLAISVCVTLVACVSVAPSGRKQITAPPQISSVYSGVNMQLALATEANMTAPCQVAECESDKAFEQRVLSLGSQLAQAAYIIYPELSTHIEKFEFSISEKSHPGSISNSDGKVVIFRGVEKLLLPDEVLAFLIALEMGHVISRHHEENSATGLIYSSVTAALIPLTNFFIGSQVIAPSTAPTTMTTSVASYFGYRMVLENSKPYQVGEAETIAVQLLDRSGYSLSDVASALITSTRVMGYDEWSNDLRASALSLFKMSNTPEGSISEDKLTN